MKNPSKKAIIREIAENIDLFDFTSLARTNITNLIFMEGNLSNFPEIVQFFQNFFNFSITMHNQKYIKYNVPNVYRYFLD